MAVVGWVVSQRLLSLNPTTVLVVLLLGLWLLLGCDNSSCGVTSTVMTMAPRKNRGITLCRLVFYHLYKGKFERFIISINIGDLGKV